MAKSLDFNTLPKRYLTVTLADENKTTLMIGTPTKQIMDDMIVLQNLKDNVDVGTEVMDELYGACARIMNRNKGGIRIEKELLEEIFDFEDILIFFNAYTNFISEINQSKN
jgi:hypothetical protein